jgi:YggT family protein
VLTILYDIVQELLLAYRWVIIVAAVFSMLVSFGVLDSRNRLVWTIGDFLFRVTEPALRPIRNAMPRFGNIDLSPIVLIVLIYVVQSVLQRIYFAILTGSTQGLLL